MPISKNPNSAMNDDQTALGREALLISRITRLLLVVLLVTVICNLCIVLYVFFNMQGNKSQGQWQLPQNIPVDTHGIALTEKWTVIIDSQDYLTVYSKGSTTPIKRIKITSP